MFSEIGGLGRARLPAALLVAAALVQAGPAWAAATDQDQLNQLLTTLDAQKAKLDQQEKLLRQQMQQLQQQQNALQQQQQQIDALRTQVNRRPAPASTVSAAPAAPLSPGASAPLSPATLAGLRGAGTAETAQAPEQPVGQAPPAPERPPEVNVLADRGGVLTPRGALVYEPTLDFAHTTSNNAVLSGFTVLPALTVGEIDISKVNQDIFQAVNTFRYGVTNRLEVETRVPYVWGRQETTERPLNVGTSAVTQFNASGADLGDVEAAAHYQINSGTGGWPYFIGNVRFKSTTGTDPFSIPLNPASGLPSKVATGSGFYDVEPSLTVIYPSDPAVFFANAGYIFGISANKNLAAIGATGSGNVDPGSAIHVSFGLGFGINEASSFSLGYDYTSFSPQLINGVAQPGTSLQIGSVLIGYSYRFNDRVALNLTTGIGTTNDAPNTHVVLRVPIQFQVFGDRQ
jgi:hypothetical protein